MSHCQITLSVNAGVALHLGAMRVWSDALHDRRVVGFSTVTPERWNILQAHPDFARSLTASWCWPVPAAISPWRGCTWTSCA